MPVLLEAISVIVRRGTIERKYPGGVQGYARDCLNQTFCDRPNFAYLTGTSMESGIAVPAGWSEEESLKRSGRMLTPEQASEHLGFLRSDGNVDVYRDRRTGQEWYLGRGGDASSFRGPVGEAE